MQNHVVSSPCICSNTANLKQKKKHCRTATAIFKFLEDLKYNKEVEGV